jgi:hypothetical protein
MNKSTVFCDVLTIRGLVEVYWRLGRTCDLKFLDWSVSKARKQEAVTQDEDRMFVWNVGKLLPDYTAPHPTSRHRDYLKSHIWNQLCVVDFVWQHCEFCRNESRGGWKQGNRATGYLKSIVSHLYISVCVVCFNSFCLREIHFWNFWNIANCRNKNCPLFPRK